MVHPACVGYEIIFANYAKKELQKLEKSTIKKILQNIKKIASKDLGLLNIKKLKSKHSLYRLRVGDYRIIYSLQHEEIIIYIVSIGHRRDIYKKLDKRVGCIT